MEKITLRYADKGAANILRIKSCRFQFRCDFILIMCTATSHSEQIVPYFDALSSPIVHTILITFYSFQFHPLRRYSLRTRQNVEHVMHAIIFPCEFYFCSNMTKYTSMSLKASCNFVVASQTRMSALKNCKKNWQEEEAQESIEHRQSSFRVSNHLSERYLLFVKNIAREILCNVTHIEILKHSVKENF